MLADSDPAARVMGVDDVGDLDPFFYCTYHADLKGFGAREAQRHYRRYGRREARAPNPSAMLKQVQAEEGPLPADFQALAYLRLNQDLRHQLHHDWQAAEHYLRHGRRHGRVYKVAPSGLTDRSSVSALRRGLIQAFGDALVDEALVRFVHHASARAEGSATLAAPLMSPVLLARWLLTYPDAIGVDLTDLRIQLTILFRIVFELHPITGRSAAEMQVINHLRRLAISTTVCEAGGALPPVTILMLAARAVSEEPFHEAPTLQEAVGIVGRFFTRDVLRMELQRYVTPEQRALLRAPVTAHDATPLAVFLLEDVEGLTALALLAEPTELKARFLEEGVWLARMEYILSAQELEAAQVQLRTEGRRIALSMPRFLASDCRADGDSGELGAPEAADDWLQRFVFSEREDRGLPEILVGASASTYAFSQLAPQPTRPVHRGARGGRKPLRAGDMLTFGSDGTGPGHLIGDGWHDVEVTHVWSAAKHALVSINLDEEDNGPLDLYLRLSPGPIRQPQVTAWWNGRPVGAVLQRWDRIFTLHCHLGARHNSGEAPNILGLSIDELFKVQTDERHLGVALYDLMLVRR